MAKHLVLWEYLVLFKMRKVMFGPLPVVSLGYIHHILRSIYVLYDGGYVWTADRQLSLSLKTAVFLLLLFQSLIYVWLDHDIKHSWTVWMYSAILMKLELQREKTNQKEQGED